MTSGIKNCLNKTINYIANKLNQIQLICRGVKTEANQHPQFRSLEFSEFYFKMMKFQPEEI